MVDAVGGVDINVKKALDDPNYPGLDGKRGWSVEPGQHHFNGTRRPRLRPDPEGRSARRDLTRAARQQEVLVALRNRVVGRGHPRSTCRGSSPRSATTVRTDLPQDRLPELAALAEQIGGSSTMKVVLTSPQIKSGGSTKYGSVFAAGPGADRALTKVVFGPPGADPTWPVPSPSARPSRDCRRARARPPRRSRAVDRRAARRTGLRRRPRREPSSSRSTVVVAEEQPAVALGDEALRDGVVEERLERARSSRRRRAARSAWRGGRAGPTTGPPPAPRACRGRRAARGTRRRASAIPAFRSWSVSTTRSSVRPGWASSRSTRPRGITPIDRRRRPPAPRRRPRPSARAGRRRTRAGSRAAASVSPTAAAAADVARIAAGARAAEHADRADRPSSRPALRTRARGGSASSAARPGRDARRRASPPADHWPNVRPPGGSPAGSKIGS